MHNGDIGTALTDPLDEVIICIKFFFVYKYTCTCLISLYFERFSTETFNIWKKKKMIFLILCQMTERRLDKKQILPQGARFSAGHIAGWVSDTSQRDVVCADNSAWFTAIARRRKLCGGSSIVRRCTLERIKGINQIHCCALSDERHGAEWMKNRFFTLSCRWCFSMHFYGEPISRWVQSYQMQRARLSAALGHIQWHSSRKEFLLFSPRTTEYKGKWWKLESSYT